MNNAVIPKQLSLAVSLRDDATFNSFLVTPQQAEVVEHYSDFYTAI